MPSAIAKRGEREARSVYWPAGTAANVNAPPSPLKLDNVSIGVMSSEASAGASVNWIPPIGPSRPITVPAIFTVRTAFNWKSMLVRSSPELTMTTVAREAEAAVG